MQLNHPKTWSFRQQLYAIILIALFFIVGSGLFGTWRLLQFSSSQMTIQPWQASLSPYQAKPLEQIAG